MSSQYGVNRPAIRFCPANRRPRTTFNECMAVNGVMPLIAPIRQGETSTYSVFRHSGSGMPTANTVNEQDVSCLKHTMTFAMMFVNKNRLGSILFWTIFQMPKSGKHFMRMCTRHLVTMIGIHNQIVFKMTRCLNNDIALMSGHCHNDSNKN